MSRSKKLQESLLSWYDAHRRVMPWRALPGRKPDPYHVWMSEIMLQQTTVVTVGPYFMKFIKKWPTVKHLARADIDDVLAAWAGLGYYARARNLHKCAVMVTEKLNGIFPDDIDALLELPGIGPYTAAAITSIAFDKPAVAVDGNVERVVSRYFAITEPLPHSKDDIRSGAAQLAKDCKRPGDFTQAFMELGATVCTPRKPKCAACPWQSSCKARRDGTAEELPRKVPKAAKPLRHGRVYWIENGKGAFLIEKRKGKGLFEGMYQLPTTEWLEKPVKTLGKGVAGAKNTGLSVRHSFTHFDLILEIWQLKKAGAAKVYGGLWISPRDTGDYALPTLMKKAIRLMDDKRRVKV